MEFPEDDSMVQPLQLSKTFGLCSSWVFLTKRMNGQTGEPKEGKKGNVFKLTLYDHYKRELSNLNYFPQWFIFRIFQFDFIE